ncbi:porin OmpL1 [Leptospira langatensis]|uniref:Porin OmpL1 n=1 Tax=Leptospira langatensis TaxID=2484983 RepID=A0A5F1ZT12_9LEPT|nr:porin OmpL1 [Leptospira langatensis]TGK02570.1 porin OmpL1 [Leptospira langatensis]TGL40229.1 porin OmpL1 [Leptospira langatensis]
MIRNKWASLALLLLIPFGYADAKSYVMGSLGLQFDLGSLGNTIATDGLNASSNYSSTASDGTPGILPRRVIIPEDRLLTLQHTTDGLIKTKASGAMSGIVLSLGFEQDFGKAFFWRVNAHYTRKVMGGDTTSSFLGYQFYDVTWDYNAVQIPVNVGIKLSATENTSFYIGAGAHYFKGGWTLEGSNRAEDVHQFLAAVPGATQISDLLADGTSPVANWEKTTFTVSGFAPNWLIGAQSRISDKGHIYMEAETLYSFKYGIAHPSSLGGALGLAPSVAYPIVLGGTQYRFGYKHEI